MLKSHLKRKNNKRLTKNFDVTPLFHDEQKYYISTTVNNNLIDITFKVDNELIQR